MKTVRFIAFMLSGTAAFLVAWLVLDGSLPADSTKERIIGLWLWLGWAVPAAVLLIDRGRS